MKYLLFANTDWYLYNFRLSLAAELRGEGHEVILLSPPGEYGPLLRGQGFDWIPFPFSRRGINPLRELITIVRLFRIYNQLKPDVVHHFTIKCVVYGGIAASASGISAKVAAITGLGHIFTTNNSTNRILRCISSVLYREALKGTQVIFQNDEDLQLFLREKIVRKECSHLISGSGVDTRRFVPRESARLPGPIRVVMVARLLKEKGVREYIDAARSIRSRRNDISFQLVGDVDPGNPSSLSSEEVADINTLGDVQLPGHLGNIHEVLQNADLAVLPSYREGTPRSLLEAAACGLPLIATEIAGCMQVAHAGKNALLVPVGDVDALASAITILADSPSLREQFAIYSRELAIKEFDVALVNQRTRKVHQSALASHDT